MKKSQRHSLFAIALVLTMMFVTKAVTNTAPTPDMSRPVAEKIDAPLHYGVPLTADTPNFAVRIALEISAGVPEVAFDTDLDAESIDQATNCERANVQVDDSDVLANAVDETARDVVHADLRGLHYAAAQVLVARAKQHNST